MISDQYRRTTESVVLEHRKGSLMKDFITTAIQVCLIMVFLWFAYSKSATPILYTATPSVVDWDADHEARIKTLEVEVARLRNLITFHVEHTPVHLPELETTP